MAMARTAFVSLLALVGAASAQRNCGSNPSTGAILKAEAHYNGLVQSNSTKAYALETIGMLVAPVIPVRLVEASLLLDASLTSETHRCTGM